MIYMPDRENHYGGDARFIFFKISRVVEGYDRGIIRAAL